MKAIRVNAPLDIEVCEIPIPTLENGDDVLLRVRSAGLCGSDIHIYHGTNPVAVYPRVVGHEFAGEVVGVGSDVGDLAVGDHVVVDPVISCGHCYPCSIGRPNVCVNLQVIGVHQDGGFREYAVISRKNVHRISKELSWEEATLIEPFTIAAQVVSRGRVIPEDTVLIMGAGPIGLCILQAVKRIGARCIISDLVEERLAKAVEMGADLTVNPNKEDLNKVVMEQTDNGGMPVIIDAVCLPQTFEQALKMAAPAGRVLVLSLAVVPSQVQQLDIMKKELDVIGSRLSNRKFPEVIGWFERREVKPMMIASHFYHFTNILEAINQVEKHPEETSKVILKFD